MPHSIDQAGKVIVKLSDYDYLKTVRYRERIQQLCIPLQGIAEIKYFSLLISFNDGQKYSISNMPLWAIPYHTLGYVRADADAHPISAETEGYFLHKYMKYDVLQNIILNDLTTLYCIYPAFALVRKCLECVIVAEAYYNDNLENPLSVYKEFEKKFERFCIYFIEHTIDIILETAPSHKYDKFLSDSKYRHNILHGINTDQTLTPREIECIQWASVGKTSEEIGIILGLSKRTVEAFLNNSKHKMECNNLTQLVAKCIKYSLI